MDVVLVDVEVDNRDVDAYTRMNGMDISVFKMIFTHVLRIDLGRVSSLIREFWS